MVKAIWVEGMNSVERTETLRRELLNHGYKLSLDELSQLFEKKGLSDLIDQLKKRRVATIGTKYEAPTMATYGIMRLNQEYGFYISYLKLRPEGFPEVRLVIENEREFEAWIQGFTQEFLQWVKEPNRVLLTAPPKDLAKLGDTKVQVRWDGLIETFTEEGVGEYKVVQKAEGLAPWGSTIKAELQKSELSNDVLISLPEQNGFLLAILDGNAWEIWVTPRGQIHVVRPKPVIRYPPDEYLTLTEG
jgi:hypothetical protein